MCSFPTDKFLDFQRDVETYRNNVVEDDKEGEDVLDHVDCLPREIVTEIPVICNRLVRLKRVILEVETEGVSQTGAEDDLGHEETNVDEDDLVHGLLHSAELVGAQLGVHGHLGVWASVDSTAEH